MSFSTTTPGRATSLSAFFNPGMLCLLLATIAAGIYFREGIDALLVAWQLPEYGHGPLIPVLSGLLFLRQLKEVPVNHGPVTDRGVGVGVLIFALALGLVGKLARIDDIVAYALIVWVGAILLISFGWRVGKQFWPPVVHLICMLPLPGVLYYKGDHATANAFGTFKQEDELTAMMPPRGDEHEDDDATVAVLFKFDSDASNPKPYGGFDLEFAAIAAALAARAAPKHVDDVQGLVAG